MKLIITLFFGMALSAAGFSQTDTSFKTNILSSKTDIHPQNGKYTYAYILIEGKLFSKKLKVSVDFGDTPEQLNAGKEYSEKLTGKKSFAAVLNHMVESRFELVETLDYSDTYSGSGGTSGIVFIMRKSLPEIGS